MQRTLTTAAGALLLLLLAGCSAEAKGPTPPATATELPPAKAVAAALAGAEKAGTHRFRMKLDISARGKAATMYADGRVDSRRDAMLIGVSTNTARVPTYTRMISVKDKLYVQSPQRDERWREVAVDYAPGQTTDLAESDPRQQLDLLRGVSDDIRRVGPETVNELPATRYDATVDLVALAKSSGGLRARRAQLDAYRALGVTKLPVSLYLYDDGLPARIVIAFTSSAAVTARDGATSTDLTIDYYNWGKPVPIELPNQARSR